MPYREFYDILGVSPSATQKEIKSAYRKLALKHHPDKSKNTKSEEIFKKITNAYETLKNEDTRAQYDKFGPNMKQNNSNFMHPNNVFQHFFGGPSKYLLLLNHRYDCKKYGGEIEGCAARLERMEYFPHEFSRWIRGNFL